MLKYESAAIETNRHRASELEHKNFYKNYNASSNNYQSIKYHTPSKSDIKGKRTNSISNSSGSDMESYKDVNSTHNQAKNHKEHYESEKKDKDYRDQHNQQQQQQHSVVPKLNKGYLLKMKRKYKYKISANISGTKFDILRQVLDAMGFRILSENNFDSNLIWDDTRVSVEGISELRAFQRYNHFPAMSEISKKDALAKNISKLSKIFPQDFDFVPKTWIMPAEYTNLLSYAVDMKKMNQKRTYILKPSNGAMGHGIKLYKNVEKIQPTENLIVQEYIGNPYLLDGYKFDLRIYALVTSCDPLRAFIYNNGLVRLGTEIYQEPNESNIDHLFMHLTNYSVNKKNKHYDEGDPNGESGTKRSLKHLFDHLRRNGEDSSKLWKNIQDIILKTLLVAEPYLFHTYKMCRPGQIPGTESVCFEILGFDILLDENLKPWVLEVNRSPSFGANQQIDFDIKSHLLFDSFELLHLRSSDRIRSQQIEKNEAQRRLYNLNSYSIKTDRSELNGFSGSDLSIQKSTTTLSSNGSSMNLLNNKKYKSKEKRKSELIDQLKLMRREQRQQDYENRNLGNYSRLFPIDDRSDMDYYLNILSSAFNLFYPIGKQVQWRKTYERIKEDELLNELAECDEELVYKSDYEQNKILNEYLKDEYLSSESEEENDSEHNEHYRDRYNRRSNDYKDENDYEDLREFKQNRRHPSNDFREPNDKPSQKRVSTTRLIQNENIKSNRLNTLLSAVSKSPINSKLSTPTPPSSRLTKSNVDSEYDRTIETMNANNGLQSQKSLVALIHKHQEKKAKLNGANVNNHNNNNSDKLASTSKENTNGGPEEIDNNNLATLTIAVLKLLNQLEIKFPGKTSEDTKNILSKIYSKFDAYRPKLADYWMVKLDDTKRIKILNIVKSNLIVILQKVFCVESVEHLRLYKIFIKLLNRMAWMHGQGLWNSLTNVNNYPWDTIFNKSTFAITENELKCCQRIVDLCKDCVLVVYQYAFEQKPSTNDSTPKSSLNGSASNLIRHNSNNNLITSRYKASISASTNSLSPNLLKLKSK